MFRKPARSEVVLMGLIALLLTTIALLPWKHFAALNREAQNSKYAFVNLRRPNLPVRNAALWRANAEYSLSGGTLLVRLSNRYGEPADGLRLEADFTTGSVRAPSAVTLLRGQPDGGFRTDNLQLARGDWILGLTGTRRSEFVFRLEQPLKVE